MIRISLPYVFNLANALEPLSKIVGGPDRFSAVVAVWQAQAALNELLSASVFAPEIRSSRSLGGTLLAALNKFAAVDLNKPIEPYEAFAITNAYSQFKIALLAELGIAPSYFVSQKASFSTLSLLDDPKRLYPSDLFNKVPEAIFDVIEVGKALAFELATACGFHAFRATESVIRRYYIEVTGGKAPPKVRNIAVYVNAMRQSGHGDLKILSSLTQMSSLHRNPLIHPEAALTLDEAIAILGISHSVITAMLVVLPAILPTTAAVVPPTS